MKALVFAGFVAVLLLAACGTASQKTASSPSAAPAAATPAPQAPSAQAVRVPAESAKKVVLRITGAKDAVEARDWAGFKDEWRATFADHAKEAGIVHLHPASRTWRPASASASSSTTRTRRPAGAVCSRCLRRRST